MRKEKYTYCKDDLSKTYADLSEISLEVILGPPSISEATMHKIASDFPSYDRQEVIQKGQLFVELCEKVLRMELNEEQLISEWEKIR